jgi:phosphopantothenoylcysteine synthetase/decarboxylase
VIVPPGSGWLSCRQRGTGRMAEPDEITAAIRTALATRPPRRDG